MHLYSSRNKDIVEHSTAERRDFCRLQIYKRFRDGSEPQPVAAFLTHYGARKALNRLVSESPEDENCEWLIVPLPPIEAEE
jgi:hypothetical protein